MQRWNGKIAVVTGASVGIGAAIAKTLAENGLIVIGLARRVDKVKELAEKTEGTIHAMQCNLMNENEIIDVFRTIENDFGGVDLLINNAGIISTSGLVDGSVEEWRQTITTNILSSSICTKEAMKSMRKRGDNGHIVNINSVTAHQTNLGVDKLGMYIATKRAITGLTQSLKTELKNLNSNIKVTSLSPGAVHTDMAIKAFKDMLNVDIPTLNDPCPQAFLTPQDMADVLLLIISLKPHIEIQELTLEAMGNPFNNS